MNIWHTPETKQCKQCEASLWSVATRLQVTLKLHINEYGFGKRVFSLLKAGICISLNFFFFYFLSDHLKMVFMRPTLIFKL